jgi:hypothetical protein
MGLISCCTDRCFIGDLSTLGWKYIHVINVWNDEESISYGGNFLENLEEHIYHDKDYKCHFYYDS